MRKTTSASFYVVSLGDDRGVWHWDRDVLGPVHTAVWRHSDLELFRHFSLIATGLAIDSNIEDRNHRVTENHREEFKSGQVKVVLIT